MAWWTCLWIDHNFPHSWVYIKMSRPVGSSGICGTWYGRVCHEDHHGTWKWVWNFILLESSRLNKTLIIWWWRKSSVVKSPLLLEDSGSMPSTHGVVQTDCKSSSRRYLLAYESTAYKLSIQTNNHTYKIKTRFLKKDTDHYLTAYLIHTWKAPNSDTSRTTWPGLLYHELNTANNPNL